MDGIEQLTGIKCGVKWPNDIILNNRKLGGILIETKKCSNAYYIVIGIGINVNEDMDDLHANIKQTSISLKIFNNLSIQREQLLASILNILEQRFLNPWENNIKVWEKKCIHSNKNITFKYNKNIIEGIFEGLNEKGEAKISSKGQQLEFSSGVLTL